MSIEIPTVYRITRKMAEKAISLLENIYVEDILCYLNKDAVKRVAGLTNAKGISAVYVGEDRKAGTGHFLLPPESIGVESVICNGTPVEFKDSLIEKSKYIDFNLPLKNIMKLKITYK